MQVGIIVAHTEEFVPKDKPVTWKIFISLQSATTLTV